MRANTQAVNINLGLTMTKFSHNLRGDLKFIINQKNDNSPLILKERKIDILRDLCQGK
jgi:hypothetical protein